VLGLRDINFRGNENRLGRLPWLKLRALSDIAQSHELSHFPIKVTNFLASKRSN
jgi:hypothetical protein